MLLRRRVTVALLTSLFMVMASACGDDGGDVVVVDDASIPGENTSMDDASGEVGADVIEGSEGDATDPAQEPMEDTSEPTEPEGDTSEPAGPEEDTSEPAEPEGDAAEPAQPEEDASGAGPEEDTMDPPAEEDAPEPTEPTEPTEPEEEGAFSDYFSIIDSLSLAGSDCCFDFDSDGSPDNGLGTLLEALVPLLGDGLDINGSIAEALADGSLVVLYEQVGLDETVSGDLTLNGYVGVDNGDGTYAIAPESIDAVTGAPVLSFGAEISGGVISTEPADFYLAVPLDDLDFSFTLNETEMEGDVTMAADGNGLDWSNAKLGGLVSLEEFVNSFNAVGDSCECMGLNGAPLFNLSAEDTIACSTAAMMISPGSCTAADGDLCEGIASNASLTCLGIGIVKPDIDTDGNGKKDSFSVGVTFTGISADVTGLDE